VLLQLHVAVLEFSVLTLLVGWLEGRPACNNLFSNDSQNFTFRRPSLTWSNCGKIGRLKKTVWNSTSSSSSSSGGGGGSCCCCCCRCRRRRRRRCSSSSSSCYCCRSHHCRSSTSVSQKKSPPPWGFLTFFPKRLRIFSPNFTRLLYVPIYARGRIFIQLSATLTKLCHIKCDHRVHIMCSKCPPSAETHMFRRLRKSLIALLIVVCGKSSRICCSALFSSGMVFGFDWSLWNAWSIAPHTW